MHHRRHTALSLTVCLSLLGCGYDATEGTSSQVAARAISPDTPSSSSLRDPPSSSALTPRAGGSLGNLPPSASLFRPASLGSGGLACASLCTTLLETLAEVVDEIDILSLLNIDCSDSAIETAGSCAACVSAIANSSRVPDAFAQYMETFVAACERQ